MYIDMMKNHKKKIQLNDAILEKNEDIRQLNIEAKKICKILSRNTAKHQATYNPQEDSVSVFMDDVDSDSHSVRMPRLDFIELCKKGLEYFAE